MTTQASRTDSLAAWIVLALTGFLMLATLAHDRPLAALDRDAPAAQFSAARAVDALARVLGDGQPHPLGSAANRQVRERLEAELRNMGYAPQVRTRVSCNAAGACATVENVFATLPGAGQEPGVLLASHYDSVPAAPGAGDDGGGVATLLETARALRALPTLPRDVWFLFSDGEELGLLGAEAFSREPEFKRIGIAINFEARGTTGRSRLIETSVGNAGLIAQLRRAVRGPAADSLTYEIYRRMPNDTDLTVYRRTGIPSLGFAFAGGAQRYHTQRDDLAHLDPGSVQGHGEYALNLAREFATHGVERSVGDAVYFDLFGTLVVWPQAYNGVLLAIGLVGLITLMWRLRSAAQLRWPRFLLAIPVILGVVLLALLLAIALRLALAALGALPAAWTAQSSQLVAAFLLLPVAMVAMSNGLLLRRIAASELATASFVSFAAIAIATVVLVPGASYLGLVPLLAGVAIANLVPHRPAIWAGALAIAAMPVYFGIASNLYLSLGSVALPGASLVLAFALLPLIAALGAISPSGFRLGVLASAGCLAFSAAAVVRPAFTPDTPSGTMLMLVSRPEDSKLYAYAGGQLPDALAKAGAFASRPGFPFPWWPTVPLFTGQAGPKLVAPTLELLGDTPTAKGRLLALQLKSLRGAQQGTVLLGAGDGFIGATVQGTEIPPAMLTEKIGQQSRNAWRQLSLRPLPGEGAEFSIELSKRGALDILYSDTAFGLPPELDSVAAARTPQVVPIHSGDFSQSWSVLHVPAQAAGAESR